MRYDNRDEKEAELHGRFQAGCGDAGDLAGLQASEAARNLGIGDNLVRRWMREFEEAASGERLSTDEGEELKRLCKEVCLLRMEKEILNKASQYFVKEMK